MLNRKLLAAITTTVVVLGGFSSNSFAASQTGNAAAIIVAPITILETQTMHFGEIGPGAAASTVVLSTAGAAAAGTGTPSVIPGSGARQGIFGVTGQDTYTYAIGFTAGNLTGPGSPASDMAVDTFTTTTANGQTFTGSADTINVGATLHVGASASQPAGTYNGTYQITVNYN